MTTQTKSAVGSAGLGSFLEGLAIAPDGALYGTDENGTLFSISTSTGLVTEIGDTGRGDIEALDFSGNTLLGATSGSIFSIDLGDASTINLFPNFTPGFTTDVPRTMAVVDSNTALIATFSASNQADIYSANLGTGALTYVGLAAVAPGQFLSMDIGTDGKLYGFDNSGNIWLIDQTDAGVTLLGTIPGGAFFLDATVQAVPEPSTWALLLGGSGALWLARRRRTTRA